MGEFKILYSPNFKGTLDEIAFDLCCIGFLSLQDVSRKPTVSESEEILIFVTSAIGTSYGYVAKENFTTFDIFQATKRAHKKVFKFVDLIEMWKIDFPIKIVNDFSVTFLN